jgi:hypothetical protein
VSRGAGGAEEAGGTGGSAGKRPRYAAAAEGVHVLDEEEVDMVSQVADLGRVEDVDPEAPTNKEYPLTFSDNRISDNVRRQFETDPSDLWLRGPYETSADYDQRIQPYINKGYLF